MLFLLAFLGAILNLPSFLMLGTGSIFRRMIWRYLGLLIFLSPKMLYDFLANTEKISQALFNNVVPIFLLSFLNTLYVYLVYYAVSHTYVAHTLLLCSIPSTFYCTWKIARRSPYTTVEYVGIGVNVFGAYLCCCEGSSQPSIFLT